VKELNSLRVIIYTYGDYHFNIKLPLNNGVFSISTRPFPFRTHLFLFPHFDLKRSDKDAKNYP